MAVFDKLPPVHPEGRKFVIIAAAITLLLFLLTGPHLGWVGIILTLWVAAFFRDPARVTPVGADLVVSPADGVICQIADVVPPVDMGLGDTPRTRVSVFMSVFDVHINRSPIAGTIRRIVYVPGKFLNADLDKASEDNERQMFVVTGADGAEIGFTQIAGLVARRIVRFTKEGDWVEAGQRVGLIRFGSRVDVYLPAGCAPKVTIGQRMVAGETVLGRLGCAIAVTGVTR